MPSPRLIEIVPEEHFSHGSIEIRGLDPAELSDGGSRVGPVDLAPDPVNGDAIGRHEPSRHHGLRERVRDGVLNEGIVPKLVCG